MSNIVYIATSIDGFIADRNNKLDWLNIVPNPNNLDLGFSDFINSIDVILMGRNTFESLVSMGIEWPYFVPVYALSNTLKSIPDNLENKVHIINGTPQEVILKLNKIGFKDIYIDGGKTIQSFLDQDLIDKLIITRIPVLLGGGIPLFGNLSKHLKFKLESTQLLLEDLVMTSYKRIRD